MTPILHVNITPRRRANLTKLADYLESLPEDYAHFDMTRFIDHYGGCDLTASLDEAKQRALRSLLDEIEAVESTIFAASAEQFLNNCGTVACALGHGPAADIPLAKAHLSTKTINGVSIVTEIDFTAYAKLFVDPEMSPSWDFLFSSDWAVVDGHHWGAAARIRFLLDKGGVPGDTDSWGDFRMMDYPWMPRLYAAYRVDVRCTTST